MVFVLVNIIKANKTNKQQTRIIIQLQGKSKNKNRKTKEKILFKVLAIYIHCVCVYINNKSIDFWFFVRGESSLTWISYHILDKSMFHSFIHCFYIRFRNVQNFPFSWKKSHVFLHLAVTVNRGMRKRRKLNYQIKCGWLVG